MLTTKTIFMNNNNLKFIVAIGKNEHSFTSLEWISAKSHILTQLSMFYDRQSHDKLMSNYYVGTIEVNGTTEHLNFQGM